MALEQWEIDLRKQLEGRVNNTKPINGQTWEDKLVEQIQNLPQVQQRVAEKPKPKTNTALMVVVLIVLGLATLFAYDSKSGGKIQTWIQSKFSSTPTAQLDPDALPVRPTATGPAPGKSYDADIAALRGDIKRVEADNKAGMDKLEAKVKWNNDRIVLMGLLLNENFMIVRNNHSKANLIFFNRDWTLDQMPHYLELSDDDREYLKKFVKPGQ